MVKLSMTDLLNGNIINESFYEFNYDFSRAIDVQDSILVIAASSDILIINIKNSPTLTSVFHWVS